MKFLNWITKKTVVGMIWLVIIGVALIVVVFGKSEKPTSSDGSKKTANEIVVGNLPAPIETDTPEASKPLSTFGAGTWEVNVDIKPGKYKTSGGDTCYYARLSSFEGTNNIIANDISQGPAIVEILASDKGFKTSGCADWTLTE